MKQNIIITNEKGFFGKGQNLVLVKKEDLEIIQNLLKTNPDPVLQWGYDILCTLPLVQGRLFSDLKNWRADDRFEGVGFWYISTFLSKNNHPGPQLIATEEGLGWSGLRQFYEKKTYLQKFVKTLEEHRIFLFPLIENQSFKAFSKRTLTFKINEEYAWKCFSQSDCVLIFGKTKHTNWQPSKQGYLDAHGILGEIRSARIFESIGSAEKTINASYSLKTTLEAYCFVHASLQIKNIEPKHLGQIGEMTQLQETMAFMEKQQLKEALSKASEEDLKQQLAQFKNNTQPVEKNDSNNKKRL